MRKLAFLSLASAAYSLASMVVSAVCAATLFMVAVVLAAVPAEPLRFRSDTPRSIFETRRMGLA